MNIMFLLICCFDISHTNNIFQKQSLLIGPDDDYESSTNLKGRTMSSTSSLVQRRASPTAATNVRQMNIIKEDKEENHFRKEQ